MFVRCFLVTRSSDVDESCVPPGDSKRCAKFVLKVVKIDKNDWHQ